MSVPTFPLRNGNVPRDAHPDIVMLLRYWQYIHPGNRLPGCAHFNLAEIPALRPHMRLLDVVAGGQYRYRVRMIGAAHLRQLGFDPTGSWYEAITSRFRNSIVELDLARVCHRAEPVYRKGRTVVPYVSGNEIIERVHVPLASDGKNVDCIASLTLFFPAVRKGAGPRPETQHSDASVDGNHCSPDTVEDIDVAARHAGSGAVGASRPPT